MIFWTPAFLNVLYACVLYFSICTCSAQLSMFHMERRSRTLIIIIVIISGPQLEFNLVKEPPQLEEEEDVAAFACPVSTTTAVVPYRSPSPSPSPAEQCTVAVVTFETEGFSVVSDGDTSAANTDNGHNYDFYH